MITNAGLPKHYKEKHSKDPSSEHVPCGTCDLILQPTSRIKHIRGTHLRLLDTPCPIGGKIFSRRDAAKRHAKDCDGSCAGDRTERNGLKRRKRGQADEPEEEQEDKFGNEQTDDKKRAQKRARRH